MSDNLTTSVGTVATQESGGVHTQRHTADAAATATVSNVAAAIASTTLVASNTARKALYVFNDSDYPLRVKYGTAVSTTSFTVKIAAGEFWEMPTRPVFTGELTGIWESAIGSARVTEV